MRLKNDSGFKYIIGTMNAKVHTHPVWLHRGGTLMPAEGTCVCVCPFVHKNEQKKDTERERMEKCHIHLKTLKM